MCKSRNTVSSNLFCKINWQKSQKQQRYSNVTHTQVFMPIKMNFLNCLLITDVSKYFSEQNFATVSNYLKIEFDTKMVNADVPKWWIYCMKNDLRLTWLPFVFREFVYSSRTTGSLFYKVLKAKIFCSWETPTIFCWTTCHWGGIR